MLKPLLGVVACGGNSSRMKVDKSLLNYHGKPQRYHLSDMLIPFCTRVFISCNLNQSEEIISLYSVLVDSKEFSGCGPVSGLLSAFNAYPDYAILYIGCDYPYLKNKDLQQLIQSRNPDASAVCFIDSASSIPEPLLAIYEHKCHTPLVKRFLENKYSLREFLLQTNTVFLNPLDKNVIKSVDTPEQYRNELLHFKID